MTRSFANTIALIAAVLITTMSFTATIAVPATQTALGAGPIA
jgi:hypothetical protein